MRNAFEWYGMVWYDIIWDGSIVEVYFGCIWWIKHVDITYHSLYSLFLTRDRMAIIESNLWFWFSTMTLTPLPHTQFPFYSWGANKTLQLIRWQHSVPFHSVVGRREIQIERYGRRRRTTTNGTLTSTRYGARWDFFCSMIYWQKENIFAVMHWQTFEIFHSVTPYYNRIKWSYQSYPPCISRLIFSVSWNHFPLKFTV